MLRGTALRRPSMAQQPRHRRRARASRPELDEIFNPTWAPNGQAICFTGMTRGLTDLFVYDLGSAVRIRTGETDNDAL